MKIYTIKVVIEEGCDEWWEEITKDHQSGADLVRKCVETVLDDSGISATVTLEKYEDN